MRRFATIAITVWVWVMSAHAQSALTPADSIDSAIASMMLPSIKTELDGKTPAYRSNFIKGLRDGAADSTLIAYAKAILIGSQMQEWIDSALYGDRLGADRANIIGHLCTYIESGKSAMAPESAQEYIQQKILDAFDIGSLEVKADPQKEAAFLAKAAATEGAVMTPDSVIVISQKEGTGRVPVPGSIVIVTYTGSLSDGGVFDETGGKPVRLEYDSLVPGMQQGLSEMRAGGKAKIYIPASAGYGDEGFPGVIPGGYALLFEIELNDVQ